MPHALPHRLPRRRRLVVHVVFAGLWASGAFWLVLRCGLQREGEFGPTPHPVQPWMLRAHALFAFAALWLGGLLWAVHIAPAWRRGYRPVSGMISIGALLALAATGYLLYYVGDDRWRVSLSTIHWVLGLAAAVPFLVHVVRHGYRRRREMPSAPWHGPDASDDASRERTPGVPPAV